MKVFPPTEYPHGLDTLRRLDADYRQQGQVPLVNLGYLFNEGIPADQPGHIHQQRVTDVFSLGWTEDLVVERSETRSQHPLIKPEYKLHAAIYRMLLGRPPFNPFAVDAVHGLLRKYGPQSTGQIDHWDHGLRVWTPQLHEVIAWHYAAQHEAYSKRPALVLVANELESTMPATATTPAADHIGQTDDVALAALQQARTPRRPQR